MTYKLLDETTGTDRLFEALIEKITDKGAMDLQEEMNKEKPAKEILNKALALMEDEMKHPDGSLSIAIYEYAETVNRDVMEKLNANAQEKWRKLIRYGIKRGEFNNVDVDEIVSVILYSYQGARMWSRIIPMKPKVFRSIAEHIRKQLTGG